MARNRNKPSNAGPSNGTAGPPSQPSAPTSGQHGTSASSQKPESSAYKLRDALKRSKLASVKAMLDLGKIEPNRPLDNSPPDEQFFAFKREPGAPRCWLVGETPMHLAVWREDISALKLLTASAGGKRVPHVPCRLKLPLNKNDMSEFDGISPVLLALLLPFLKTPVHVLLASHAREEFASETRCMMLQLVLEHDANCAESVPEIAPGVTLLDAVAYLCHITHSMRPFLQILASTFKHAFPSVGCDARTVLAAASLPLLKAVAPTPAAAMRKTRWPFSSDDRLPGTVFSCIAILIMDEGNNTGYNSSVPVNESTMARELQFMCVIRPEAESAESPPPSQRARWLEQYPPMLALHFCMFIAAIDWAVISSQSSIRLLWAIEKVHAANEYCCGVSALYLARAIDVGFPYRAELIRMLLRPGSPSAADSEPDLKLPCPLKLLACPSEVGMWFGDSAAPNPAKFGTCSMGLLAACIMEAMPGDLDLIKQIVRQPNSDALVSHYSEVWSNVASGEKLYKACPLMLLTKSCPTWWRRGPSQLEDLAKEIIGHPSVSFTPKNAGVRTGDSPLMGVLSYLMGLYDADSPEMQAALCVLRVMLDPTVVRRHPDFPHHLPGLQPNDLMLIQILFRRTSLGTLKVVAPHCLQHRPYPALNLLLMACASAWPDGVAELLRLSDGSQSSHLYVDRCLPLHWICRAGSSWQKADHRDEVTLVGSREIPFKVQDDIVQLFAKSPSTDINVKDADGRSPLFYAHTLGALTALLSHAEIDINMRDRPPAGAPAGGALTPLQLPYRPPYSAVMFRIAATADKAGKFDMSLKDQIRHIVSHPKYNHSASLPPPAGGGRKKKAPAKQCTTLALEAGRRDIALVCHSAKIVRQLCPELSMQQTYRVIEAFDVLLQKKCLPRSEAIKASPLFTATLDNMDDEACADLFRSFKPIVNHEIDEHAWHAHSYRSFLDATRPTFSESRSLRKYTASGNFMEKIKTDFGPAVYGALLAFGEDEWDDFADAVNSGDYPGDSVKGYLTSTLDCLKRSDGHYGDCGVPGCEQCRHLREDPEHDSPPELTDEESSPRKASPAPKAPLHGRVSYSEGAAGDTDEEDDDEDYDEVHDEDGSYDEEDDDSDGLPSLYLDSEGEDEEARHSRQPAAAATAAGGAKAKAESGAAARQGPAGFSAGFLTKNQKGATPAGPTPAPAAAPAKNKAAEKSAPAPDDPRYKDWVNMLRRVQALRAGKRQQGELSAAEFLKRLDAAVEELVRTKGSTLIGAAKRMLRIKLSGTDVRKFTQKMDTASTKAWEAVWATIKNDRSQPSHLLAELLKDEGNRVVKEGIARRDNPAGLNFRPDRPEYQLVPAQPAVPWERPFAGTLYWEAAWTWYYMGCWAAVDAACNGPEKHRNTCFKVFHTILSNMALASNLTARALRPTSNTSPLQWTPSQPTSALTDRVDSVDAYLCAVTDAAAALSQASIYELEPGKAQKTTLLIKTRERLKEATDGLSAEGIEVPHQKSGGR